MLEVNDPGEHGTGCQTAAAPPCSAAASTLLLLCWHVRSDACTLQVKQGMPPGGGGGGGGERETEREREREREAMERNRGEQIGEKGIMEEG